jgi:murein DD-endopeptidase MepM/ murein hydrolase activator NlpD
MVKLMVVLAVVMTMLLPGAIVDAAMCQYNVTRGDTLSGIAARYDTTVAEIKAANPNTGLDLLLVGQTISVPCGSQANVVTPATKTRGEWILVRSGSTTARCVSALRVGRAITYAPRGWCYRWMVKVN